MSLAEADLRWLQSLIGTSIAMSLDAARSDRAGLRLMPVAQRAGLPSVEALIAAARRDPKGSLVDQIVDAIATHETYWFRDSHPWRALAEVVVPEVANRLGGARPVRIWSAACSSGQEPYSIALALAETMGRLHNRVEIHASDFSASMVTKASDGRYTQLEMNRGLPAKLMLKYFERDGAYWRVKEDIRRVVSIERRNLARPFAATMPVMDVVCLRNVMIYFDLDVRARILGEVERVIDPGGWLILGSSETLLGLDLGWRYETVGETIVYRPPLRKGARS